MHGLAFLCINPQTKFEVPSFTISKDLIEAKFKNTGRGGLSSLNYAMI